MRNMDDIPYERKQGYAGFRGNTGVEAGGAVLTFVMLRIGRR